MPIPMLPVDQQKPCGPEGIENRKPHGHGQDLCPEFFPKKRGQHPIEQAEKEKACQVAAGGAKQDAGAGGKLGEDGQARRTQDKIEQDGRGAALAAQQGEHTEYGKGLHGKGNHGGDLDPGAEGDEDGRQGDIDQMKRFFHEKPPFVFLQSEYH